MQSAYVNQSAEAQELHTNSLEGYFFKLFDIKQKSEFKKHVQNPHWVSPSRPVLGSIGAPK